MRLLIFILLVLPFACKGTFQINYETPPQNATSCPTWTYLKQNGDCQCGYFFHEVVVCSTLSKEVEVMRCYCMTQSGTNNTTTVGNCIFNCGINSSISTYYKIPRHTRDLDNAVCGTYHREGQMCGHCKKGYGLAPYSYHLYCYKCSGNVIKNVTKYVLIAFLPLTIFYVLLLITNVSITNSSVLNPLILYGQITTTPIIAILYEFKSKHSVYLNMYITAYGIWNLDFGRTLYEPFCLHPDLSIHQVVALDYLLAVYPLFLILLTYFLVKLHDKYRLVVIIWRPFYWCVRCIQKEWDIKASLIEVFATFLLLSNVKLLTVSFELISIPITTWDVYGNKSQVKYIYHNGSMEYLGREHTPYFVLGVAVLLAFNVAPTFLLCLYPFHWFQKCLNRCSLSSPSLHIFMDAFQGCYKTTPHDYRALSSIGLIVRLLNFVIFFFTVNSSYFSVLGTLMGFLSLFTLSVRPFKSNFHNILESFMYLTLCLLGATLNTSKETVHVNEFYKHYYMISKTLFLSIPIVALGLWLVYQLLIRSNVKKMWLLLVPVRELWCERKKQECTPLLPTFEASI